MFRGPPKELILVSLYVNFDDSEAGPTHLGPEIIESGEIDGDATELGIEPVANDERCVADLATLLEVLAQRQLGGARRRGETTHSWLDRAIQAVQLDILHEA